MSDPQRLQVMSFKAWRTFAAALRLFWGKRGLDGFRMKKIFDFLL
jgi:hypothetical protein